MDILPDDALQKEKMDALVRALQMQRDVLVQTSLHLKDLLADIESEHRQVVAEQLKRYLTDMARGVRSADESDRANGSFPCQ